jgi:serine acetyltransferase
MATVVLQDVRRFARRLLADARSYETLLQRSRSGSSSMPLRMIIASRGLWLLTFHRISHFCLVHRNVRNPVWWLARVVAALGIGFSVLICRSEILSDCRIGEGIYLADKGYLICGASSIGDGSIIHDHCTIGHAVAGGAGGRPEIGRRVWIGPHCIVAGSISVGDGATLTPGSFVTFNVPPRAVVGGNPARIIRRDFDNSALRAGAPIPDWSAGRPS